MKERVKEFKRWVAGADYREKMVKLWTQHYRIKRSLEFMKQYNPDAFRKELDIIIRKRKHINYLIYTSSAVAVSLVLVFAIAYLKPGNRNENQNLLSVSTSGTDVFQETGDKKAILKLHTGEEIDLGSQKETHIENEDGILLLITPDKSLIYKSNPNAEKTTGKYNTLTVPRGGEFHLALSDGTKVWLNAESSLHYPVSFAQTREVTLSGEAYFEVFKHEKPFIIHTGANHKVEVLGTKFNLSAYSGHYTYTTLVEGKVKVHNANSSVTLQPNMQAIAGSSGEIKVKEVDADMFTSWAQGVYRFKETSLSEIAAQLSRWYDVDISFSNEQLMEKNFTGIIFRHLELGFAIETIEKTSNVKFTIENKKINVTNRKEESRNILSDD